jgi:hypothetical protein
MGRDTVRRMVRILGMLTAAVTVVFALKAR